MPDWRSRRVYGSADPASEANGRPVAVVVEDRMYWRMYWSPALRSNCRMWLVDDHCGAGCGRAFGNPANGHEEVARLPLGTGLAGSGAAGTSCVHAARSGA